MISDEAHAALVAKLRSNPRFVEIRASGRGFIVPTSAPPPHADAIDHLVDMYEQLASEFLCAQGEVTLADDCADLDRLSDAALADQLVTQWRDRVGKINFEQIVAPFGRLRSE